MSKTGFELPKREEMEKHYYDYSIFKGKNTKTVKKAVTPSTVYNAPEKTNENVAMFSVNKKDIIHRKNAEKKKIILRRRRIFFGIVVLLLLLLTVGIVSLVTHLIFAGKNKDITSESEYESEKITSFLSAKSIFYSKETNETISSLEKMLHTYTLVDDGKNAVPKTGNSASYYAWDAKKYVWLGDKSYIAQLKRNIKETAISKNGYIWSSEQSPKCPTTGSYYYDTNVKFISAVCDICLWETGTEFLYSMDTTTVNSEDVSESMSVGEKLEAAIAYVLDYQYSKNSRIIRAVNQRSLGTKFGASSNYWYNFRFGYSDAYINIYFYDCLNKLSALYATDYYKNTSLSEKYKALAADVYEGFQMFWDDENKRYVGAVDVNDEKHDYGFTFLNIEAVYYGLADEEKTEHIYSWLNGERKIEDDTSRGKDIYYHGFSPRVNTKKADANWWNSVDNSLRYDGNADYGMYWQNGGASLMVSYYDIMARFKRFGLENAMPIMKMMLTEYEKDGIIRNNLYDDSLMKVASNGDFPESGLAPCVYVYGFMGISTDGSSLIINPDFPAGTGAVGLKNLSFGGNKYSILNDDLTTYVFADYFSSVKIKLGGFPKNTKVTYICYDNNEPIYEKYLISDNDGFVYIEDRIGENVFVKFTTLVSDN